MYVYHSIGTDGAGFKFDDGPRRADRAGWLNAILAGRHNPKPPEWWLASQQREEGRGRTQASIIWARHYKPARKYLIWAQAPHEDFRRLGYLEG